MKGFKDFLLRGNVVDLAVAFVIGAAFATVIASFTEGVVQPLINSAGSAGSPALGFFIRDGDVKTFVDIGRIITAIITAIINFVMVAAVIYFVVVVPVSRLMERRKRGEEPDAEAPSEDILLRQEIRDLLRQRAV